MTIDDVMRLARDLEISAKDFAMNPRDQYAIAQRDDDRNELRSAIEQYAREQRTPLTEEQIELIEKKSSGLLSGELYPHLFARAIERAHQIG